MAEIEPDRLSQKFQRELNAGLIGLVLLAVLAQAEEDLYGYQIAKRLQELADGNAPVKQGTLYPVLRQLSANGLLASRIVPSYAGPPRRYYRITQAGRGTLAEWRGIWRNTRDFVNGFTESNGASS
ncbi:MAG: PadR family transcriptional regulator [Steroidobacteraceae bacterium]